MGKVRFSICPNRFNLLALLACMRVLRGVAIVRFYFSGLNVASFVFLIRCFVTYRFVLACCALLGERREETNGTKQAVARTKGVFKLLSWMERCSTLGYLGDIKKTRLAFVENPY